MQETLFPRLSFWRYVNLTSYGSSDKTVEILQFFWRISTFQRINTFIFEGMNGTIVFLVDDCFVMENQCSLWTWIRMPNHCFFPLFLIVILMEMEIRQFNFVRQTNAVPSAVFRHQFFYSSTDSRVIKWNSDSSFFVDLCNLIDFSEGIPHK